jgi:hypothetical protein
VRARQIDAVIRHQPLQRQVDLADQHPGIVFLQHIQTPWHAPALARLIEEYEAALPEGGWPNWVLGNHALCSQGSRTRSGGIGTRPSPISSP